MNTIDMMLENATWTRIEAPPITDGSVYATHSGVLTIGQRMFENENGQAIIADDWFDPFTNASDYLALRAWLAADDARWYKFKKELLSDWIESPEQEVLRYALTAPLETISLAAWRVIQEQPK